MNRTKQVERLRRKAERIRQFLKENGEKIGRTGKEIKSNVTDNESANMMTSHGVVQGYNGQAVVDGKFQVIVHGEAFGEGQDHYHVGPMVEGAKENLKALGHPEDCLEDKVLVADSNYSSPANLEACREEKLDAYIPDKDFRTRDPRFATQERWKFPRGSAWVWRIFSIRKSGMSIFVRMGRFCIGSLISRLRMGRFVGGMLRIERIVSIVIFGHGVLWRRR